ncbi:SAM domain-containing protein [Forsythia ovata]|uniref:SAM domain-containing protein n=1 Tax=Forsythia ovata TaxID=205694 RepID=A0ABD1WJZ6_9LAMI
MVRRSLARIISGDPPYDHHNRNPNKTWRFHKDPTLAANASKTRPLKNLINGGGSNYQDTLKPVENYTLSTEFTLVNGGESGLRVDWRHFSDYFCLLRCCWDSFHCFLTGKSDFNCLVGSAYS